MSAVGLALRQGEGCFGSQRCRCRSISRRSERYRLTPRQQQTEQPDAQPPAQTIDTFGIR